MGYEAGAIKYFLWTFVYPVPYYIFGGGLLWFWDLIDLLQADSVQEFAWSYFMMHYGIPSSIEQALGQTALGGVVATLSWYAAVKR